jgi:hypothetical protein
MRRMFGLKRDEVTGKWRKLHNDVRIFGLKRNEVTGKWIKCIIRL